MIEVELRLYAYLPRYCDGAEPGAPVRLSVEERTAVGQLLDRLGIPSEARRVVIVNGIIQPEGYVLAEGDRVAVFPPLAGGAPPRVPSFCGSPER